MSGERSTAALIDQLARNAAPVRRLRPPMLRALGWLAVVMALGAAAVAEFANWPLFLVRSAAMPLSIELTATLATGCLAVIAAFHLSMPDRSPYWLLLPMPTLAVWLAASGAGCYRQWFRTDPDAIAPGHTTDCFLFILGIGLPLAAALLWDLRRAKPLSPVPVALAGALGGASLSAFLLQFFHPFDVTVLDLGVHMLAVSIVVALGITLTRRGWGGNGSARA